MIISRDQINTSSFLVPTVCTQCVCVCEKLPNWISVVDINSAIVRLRRLPCSAKSNEYVCTIATIPSLRQTSAIRFRVRLDEKRLLRKSISYDTASMDFRRERLSMAFQLRSSSSDGLSTVSKPLPPRVRREYTRCITERSPYHTFLQTIFSISKTKFFCASLLRALVVYEPKLTIATIPSLRRATNKRNTISCSTWNVFCGNSPYGYGEHRFSSWTAVLIRAIALFMLTTEIEFENFSHILCTARDGGLHLLFHWLSASRCLL